MYYVFLCHAGEVFRQCWAKVCVYYLPVRMSLLFCQDGTWSSCAATTSLALPQPTRHHAVLVHLRVFVLL